MTPLKLHTSGKERPEHETPTSWLERSEHKDSLMDDDVDDVDIDANYNMMDDDEDNDDDDDDDDDYDDNALLG